MTSKPTKIKHEEGFLVEDWKSPDYLLERLIEFVNERKEKLYLVAVPDSGSDDLVIMYSTKPITPEKAEQEYKRWVMED